MADKTRTEWYHERIGRGYLVGVWDTRNPKGGLGKQYDVELAYGGRYICTLSSGCIGEKSAKYWYDTAVKQMRRLMFLLDGYDMACHNKMCYSTNLLATEPKDGYYEEWHNESAKIELLEEWIDDTIGCYNKESEKYQILKNEFCK